MEQLVTKDVPTFHVVAKHPARMIHQIETTKSIQPRVDHT